MGLTLNVMKVIKPCLAQIKCSKILVIIVIIITCYAKWPWLLLGEATDFEA